MGGLSGPSDASNAPVLLHPGDFVRIKASGARVGITGHKMNRGTVVYRVAYATGVEEGGFLVRELEEIA
jgi:hypothetical protein